MNHWYNMDDGPVPDVYSREAWDEPKTYKEWKTWHRHDEDAPSRAAAYEILGGYLGERKADWPLDFVEVGFGSAVDFERCFKAWQKDGAIRYVGYDITPQFAKYARRRHRGCDFREGGFTDLKAGAFDVSYTKHTLQHVSPDVYEDCLRGLLRATKWFCLISWRMPPGGGHIAYSANPGIWQNTWNKAMTDELIREEGFDIQVHEFSVEEFGQEYADGNSLYIMRRR
jgi:hypothetical protein